jgi:hypothetical protein
MSILVWRKSQLTRIAEASGAVFRKSYPYPGGACVDGETGSEVKLVDGEPCTGSSSYNEKARLKK